MTDRTTDRVALVTGGSSGIGERTAIRLKEAGFTTYAVARRVDRMRDLERAGVGTFAMDVTDDASMTSGIGRIVGEHGRLDVLVNNAGYGSYGAVENVPIDEARRQFEVNVFGAARLTQLVTPGMRERGAGRIINVSSIGGKFYEPLGAWYHATKFAVEGFSDSLRLELAPYGIRVVIVEPGPVRTEWNAIARSRTVPGRRTRRRPRACGPGWSRARAPCSPADPTWSRRRSQGRPRRAARGRATRSGAAPGRS
jgi:NAD(P)-dependent dehydrogenase (short-subunit alcohol dehydrogenase family)